VGVLRRADWGRLNCLEYVVGDQSSYLETFEDVLRGLKTYAETQFQGDTVPKTLGFDSGIHPAIRTMIQKMPNTSIRQPYAWYLRVPSLARFMRDVAPVLERRLEGSGARRFSGDLKLNFHDKTGLVMRFEQGRLREAVDTRVAFNSEDAMFPWHTFLNVVFGHRSLDEIRTMLPDCNANPKAAVLLEALFPKKRSWIMGIA
jgi:hypothetical protein